MTGRESLLIRAEQALLGSVLSDPGGQGNLLELMRPGDFWRPYHGQVLAAMQRARTGSGLPGPRAVYHEIGRDPDLPRQISGNAALLADLMQAAPRPGHAPAYAGLVIGGGIRRRITLAASRMDQAAADGDLAAAIAMTARAQHGIRVCRDRWLALPAGVRREPPDPAAHPGRSGPAASAAQAAGETRQLRGDLAAGGEAELQRRLAAIAQRIAGLAGTSADLRGAELAERQRGEAGQRYSHAEGQAIRHLIAGPAQAAAVGRWLRPGHFTDAQHRAVYRVVRDLATDGHPVDSVTVAWEAARRGIPVSIADLSDGTAPFAAAAAREVARHGTLTQIRQAAMDLQASATSHRLSTGLLLRETGQRLRELERDWPQLDLIQPAPVRALRPSAPARSREPATGQEKEATA